MLHRADTVLNCQEIAKPVGIRCRTNMMEGVRVFVKKAGVILMAAVWLPLSFFGHAQEHGFSLTGQIDKRTPVEVAYAVCSPSQTAQFHQLRLSGLGCWFSKTFGLDSAEPSFLSARTLLGSGKIWLAPAPSEPLKTWQFTHRTALHPRAPCRA